VVYEFILTIFELSISYKKVKNLNVFQVNCFKSLVGA